MADVIKVEMSERLATITLNRPEALNALNAKMLSELTMAFEHLSMAADVGAIILTGAGDKAFAAGADIKDMAGLNGMEMQRFSEKGRRLGDVMATCSKPVIAAINGYALGGGCELAMTCDIIVAGESARFGQPEVNIGIIPGGGGTQRLARVLGKQLAMEYVLTGRRFDAEMALRMGLVNRVVKKGRWLQEAIELARTVAERPPIATRLAKQAVIAAEETALSAGLEQERRLYELAMATEDRVEGMRAFLEKREPEFRGR